MTNLATLPPAASLATLDASSMQALISGGDCSKLSPDQRTAYYVARCEAAGLDPRAQPFAFTNLNGKLVLYALKSASDQLASKHKVRLTITDQRTEDGIRVVTVRAEAGDGRATEEIGALPIKGLSGEALSNALMKTVTKAKRRAILSLCVLGALDDSEVDSIPGAHHQEAARPAPAPERHQEVEVEKPAPLTSPEVWQRFVGTFGDTAAVEWKASWQRAGLPNVKPAELTPEQLQVLLDTLDVQP